MASLTFPLQAMAPLFVEQANAFVAAAAGLDEVELLDPSLCRGWSRLDLLVHVRAGLDEMAAGAGHHSSQAPDHDAASYWSGFAEDAADDPVPGILWLRRTASAYARPAGALQHLRDSVERVCAVVEGLDERPVAFQGQVLSAGDFVATWVTELAIHQLDLAVPGTPPGCPVARQTLETLAGQPLPVDWDYRTAVLVGLGKQPWPGDAALMEGFPLHL